jgi:hypothetical protein
VSGGDEGFDAGSEFISGTFEERPELAAPTRAMILSTKGANPFVKVNLPTASKMSN